MLKKVLAIIFCSALTISCSYFNEADRKSAIPKIDTVVDFNRVDAYPLFPVCKDIPSRKKQQICFQLQMSQYIYAALKKYSLSTNQLINDTVFVKLKINALGKTSLSSIKISDKTKELLPEFDSLLKVSLLKLPVLSPAIKRNMPVTTEFTLPIILKN
ncbi:MAG: hypothetical protein R3342_12295 [Lutibacter sp.]|uniref:hypothetical protein n=1 Tax=Lutibacter sp. TaxID=1925666 RepID=UPI00299E2C62|nr:hypothetical protein [Lutibacter sp.]MDX1830314.1 hypothetical protein [Lutibacter sp.]